jgi:glycosyltransferase involved in cell wall biosynthesis
MSEGTPLLSLCMIVKNEQKNLDRCLASVHGTIDEMIVVDTGSTDLTMEIAAAHGARVFQFTWQNDFSQARNYSLEQAEGTWIMFLDGDEELETSTRRNIKELLQTTTADAVGVTVRNFNPPQSLTEYHDSYQVRIFRNRPDYRFEQAVHNQILPSIIRAGGTVLEQRSLIWWHYGYMERNVQGGEDRVKRSLKMLEEAVNKDPQNAYLNAKLGIIYYHLHDYSLAYSYCYRVLMELDHKGLGYEILKDVLRILSFMAANRGYYDLAIQSAQACFDLAGEDVDGQTSALDLLGQAYGGLGENHLKIAIEMEKQPDWQARRQEWLAAFQQSRTFLQKARDAFLQLSQHASLRPAKKKEIDKDIAHCDELLNYILRREGAR